MLFVFVSLLILNLFQVYDAINEHPDAPQHPVP